MQRFEQVKQWIRSSAAKVRQQTRPLMFKVVNLLKRAKAQERPDLITPLGTLMGAIAFGLWSRSLAAAFFAGIGLLFLARIYKSAERILTALELLGGVAGVGKMDARMLSDSTPENRDRDALEDAIGSLKPWVANEVSLTEEDAKECCTVLLESIIARP